MKDLIVIGNGSFSKLLSYYVTECGERQIVAFSVDSAYIDRKEMDTSSGTVNVFPFESIEKMFPPDRFEVILGIGYSNMNQVRRDMFLRCKKKGYRVASFIHPTAVIAKNVEMGEGNIILEQSVIQPFVMLGRGNLIWHSVKIAHDGVVGSFNTLCQNTSIAGASCVEDNCFFGNSCTVFGGLTIAESTLIGAGAIVKRSTKSYEAIVPARSVSLSNRKSTDFDI